MINNAYVDNDNKIRVIADNRINVRLPSVLVNEWVRLRNGMSERIGVQCGDGTRYLQGHIEEVKFAYEIGADIEVYRASEFIRIMTPDFGNRRQLVKLTAGDTL